MGMRRYLLVALWPAGMAAITAATVVALRRAPSGQPAAAPPGSGPSGDQDTAAPQASAADTSPASPGPGPDSPGPGRALPGWVPGIVKLGAISAAGGVLSYQVMERLGRPIVRHGPTIDVPIMEWTSTHQVPRWADITERVNAVGNPWTVWGSSATAAACLATGWRDQKWLPAAVLWTARLVDRRVTLALRHKFRRLGPPDSPLGTYPSGGCSRVILFNGLIANMLWREFSGSYRGRVLSMGAVSALAFHQAYTRGYLSKHWSTDIVSGLFQGALLYVPFAVAIRVIKGPPKAAG
jgi:hypothetical protein